MSKTLDDIVEFINGKGYTGGDNELRQQILQWVNDEVVGEDLPVFGPQNEAGQVSLESYENAAINSDKDRMRFVLGQHGWKEPK